MAAPDQLYRAVTRLFALVITGFGIAMIVVAIAGGGGPFSLGVVLGVLFAALGAGRLYLSVRSS